MNRPSGRMALEFDRVTKSYEDHRVVDGFSAIVNRGEKIVLVGRNGAGKTTLLKALLADAPDRPALARRISMPARSVGVTKCQSDTSRRTTLERFRKG